MKEPTVMTYGGFIYIAQKIIILWRGYHVLHLLESSIELIPSHLKILFYLPRVIFKNFESIIVLSEDLMSAF